MKRTKFFNATRVNSIIREDAAIQTALDTRTSTYKRLVHADFSALSKDDLIFIDGFRDEDEKDGTLAAFRARIEEWGYTMEVHASDVYSWYRQVRLTSHVVSEGMLLLEDEKKPKPKTTSCNPSRIRKVLEDAGIRCVTNYSYERDFVTVRNFDFMDKTIPEATKILEGIGLKVEVVENTLSTMNRKFLHVRSA